MLGNQEKDIVQCAAVLACELHKGQVDKAGVDYFTGHLTTVAKMGSTWKEQVVGYLHAVSYTHLLPVKRNTIIDTMTQWKP